MLDVLVQTIDLPTESAFTTADLIVLRSWSEFHGLTLQMDLLGKRAGVPCDEAILLTGRNDAREWLLWRDQDGVTLTGPGCASGCYVTVSDALQAAIPPATDKLTEIRPTRW